MSEYKKLLLLKLFWEVLAKTRPEFDLVARVLQCPRFLFFFFQSITFGQSTFKASLCLLFWFVPPPPPPPSTPSPSLALFLFNFFVSCLRTIFQNSILATWPSSQNSAQYPTTHWPNACVDGGSNLAGLNWLVGVAFVWVATDQRAGCVNERGHNSNDAPANYLMLLVMSLSAGAATPPCNRTGRH